jgi:hypothetical protein
MCPACMATVAMLVVGAVSSGGVTALVVSKFRTMSGMSDARASAEKANQQEEARPKQGSNN